MQAHELTGLFGLPAAAPEVESLFSRLGTRHRPSLRADGERDYHDWVLVRRKGVELGFTESAYFAAAPRSAWGSGSLLLTHGYFYSAFDDVKTFEGELPCGLRFEDSRDAVREKLRAFEPTRRSYISDTWDIEGCRLNVRFRPAGGIERMAYWMPQAPIPRCGEVRYPAPDALVRALGRGVDAAEVLDLWGERLTPGALSAAAENGAIDLGDSFGATLETSPGDTGAPVLEAIALHRNRDQETAGWAGELPFGLDFEDSPATLFAKMPPLARQSDSAMTGHAVWRFEDFTLHVLYSSVDNRLLRLKLTAPCDVED